MCVCLTSPQVAREVALLEVDACRLRPYNCPVMRDRLLMGGWGADLEPALKFTINFSRSPSVRTIPRFTHPFYVCHSFNPVLSSLLQYICVFPLSFANYLFLKSKAQWCVCAWFVGPERPSDLWPGDTVTSQGPSWLVFLLSYLKITVHYKKLTLALMTIPVTVKHTHEILVRYGTCLIWKEVFRSSSVEQLLTTMKRKTLDSHCRINIHMCAFVDAGALRDASCVGVNVYTWAWSLQRSLQRKQEESDEFHDIPLFVKWPPDVGASVFHSTCLWVSGAYLTTRPACRAIAEPLQATKTSSGCVRVCVCTGQCTISNPLAKVCACELMWLRTLSRLSTSALKPEIMGTSMTAMLDEPEWSHLDRESGSGGKLLNQATSLFERGFFCFVFLFTWHRLLRRCGSPSCPGGLPGHRHLWAPVASG